MSVTHWQEFTCASCASAIDPTDPRVRCLVCAATCDMCANCVLGERFKEPHAGTHAVQVLKQSGVARYSYPQGVVTVPTVLGTTAICYYPPPPVPTLPLVAGGEVHATAAGLESHLAHLASDLAGESLSAGSMTGHGQDVDGIEHPPVQAPIPREQHHHLDGQDQPAAAQLPAGNPQQDDLATFLAQTQAVPPQYPGTPSQGVDQAVTAAIVPPTYQHTPPVEQSIDSSQRVEQPPSVAPGFSPYQPEEAVASSPAGTFHQVDQSPVVTTAPLTTYQHEAPAASPSALASQQVDQPRADVPPSTYHQRVPSAEYPPPGFTQHVPDNTQSAPAVASPYPQAAAVGPPAPGPLEYPQANEPHPVVAAPPAYQSPAPVVSSPSLPTSPAGPVEHPHGSRPPTVAPAYTPPAASPLAGAPQHVDQPSAIAAGVSSPYQGVAPDAFPAVTSAEQYQPPVDTAAANAAAAAAAVLAYQQFTAAGYSQPVSQPLAAAPPTLADGTPAASSPLVSSQHVDQAYTGVAAASSVYPHAAPAGSPVAGYAQPISQAASSAAGPPTYGSPAQAASSPAISPQQIGQLAASSAYQHGAPGAASPAGSLRQVDQASMAAAAPPMYQHGAPVASSSVGGGSFQQANQSLGSVTAPSMYQPAAPVGSPATGYAQPVSQPASSAAAVPPTYQSQVPVASPPASSFQQFDQPSAVPSAYQPAAAAVVASSAMGYAQPVPQLPAGAGPPSTYQHATGTAVPMSSFQHADQPSVATAAPSAYQPGPAAAASSAAGYAQPLPQLPAGAASTYQHAPTAPTGSFQHAGRPPSVASAHSGYQYAPQGVPPPTGSPAIPPNFTGAAPALPPRRATGRASSYGSPHVAPGSNLPQYQNGYQEPAPSGWQPFFLADMSPSPAFVELMNDVFTYLDPRNLGNLEPEVFSGFLDDLGYMPHENAWKSGLQATYALSAKSMADKAFKIVLDMFSIEHILLKRIQPPHEDPTGITAHYKRILGSAFNPSMLQNSGSPYSTAEGPMPAITRRGFVDLMVLEAKGEPSREWGNWSRLLRMYNLPKYANWGDLPRACFLEYPDPLTLRRVAEIRKISDQRAQEILDASRAAAKIRAQGRQNALDLISDTRYVYR